MKNGCLKIEFSEVFPTIFRQFLSGSKELIQLPAVFEYVPAHRLASLCILGSPASVPAPGIKVVFNCIFNFILQ